MMNYLFIEMIPGKIVPLFIFLFGFILYVCHKVPFSYNVCKELLPMAL